MGSKVCKCAPVDFSIADLEQHLRDCSQCIDSIREECGDDWKKVSREDRGILLGALADRYACLEQLAVSYKVLAIRAKKMLKHLPNEFQFKALELRGSRWFQLYRKRVIQALPDAMTKYSRLQQEEIINAYKHAFSQYKFWSGVLEREKESIIEQMKIQEDLGLFDWEKIIGTDMIWKVHVEMNLAKEAYRTIKKVYEQIGRTGISASLEEDPPRLC